MSQNSVLRVPRPLKFYACRYTNCFKVFLNISQSRPRFYPGPLYRDYGARVKLEASMHMRTTMTRAPPSRWTLCGSVKSC